MLGETSLLDLNYTYEANGNLLTHSIGRGTSTWQQGPFGYDGLNRLKTASETGGWSHTYVYDRYGNRAILATSVPAPDGTFTPVAQTDDPGAVEAVYSGKNQWAGAEYNAGSGEMETYPMAVPEALQRHPYYDAEHRVAGAPNSAVELVYRASEFPPRLLKHRLANQQDQPWLCWF